MKAILRRMTLGATIFLAAAGVAYAADLGGPEAPYSPKPAASWNGFYLGINGGLGSGFANHLPGVNSGTGINDFGMSGGFLGGQIGVNWQQPNDWMFGVEADLQWSGIKGACAANACGVPQATTQSIDWFGTLRGRVGFVMGNFMPYVTGGFAVGQGTRTTTSGGGSTFTAGHAGWTLGAGGEWIVAPGWSAKIEYQYLDLGAQRYAFPVGGFDPIVSLTSHIVRVGLNKHL